MLNVLNAFF